MFNFKLKLGNCEKFSSKNVIFVLLQLWNIFPVMFPNFRNFFNPKENLNFK